MCSVASVLVGAPATGVGVGTITGVAAGGEAPASIAVGIGPAGVSVGAGPDGVSVGAGNVSDGTLGMIAVSVGAIGVPTVSVGGIIVGVLEGIAPT